VASGRDYAAEYRRRKQRARELGFPSDSARRLGPRRLGHVSDFARLPESARASRSQALSVVHRARAQRTTVEEAANELGVSVRSVRYWAGEALEPTRRGRTLPRAGDRLLRLRPLILEGENELVFVAVRGSGAADRADAVFDLQWRFITGQADEAELDQIRGARIAGRVVESEPDRLEHLARAGTLDSDEIYRELVG
jgi:hypothetical protein